MPRFPAPAAFALPVALIFAPFPGTAAAQSVDEIVNDVWQTMSPRSLATSTGRKRFVDAALKSMLDRVDRTSMTRQGCFRLASRVVTVATNDFDSSMVLGANEVHLKWIDEEVRTPLQERACPVDVAWNRRGGGTSPGSLPVPTPTPVRQSAPPPPPPAPAPPSPQWQGVYSHIDWMWGNSGPPREFYCKNSEIHNAAGQFVRRLDASARDVVVNAIRAARSGDYTLALNWLASGQCHNADAANEIRSAGRAAVDYAVTKYGQHVYGGGGGGGTPAAGGQTIVYSNTSGRTLYVYEAIGPMGHTINCSSLQYKRAISNGAEYRSAPLAAGTWLWARLQENTIDACDSRYNKFEGRAVGPR